MLSSSPPVNVSSVLLWETLSIGNKGTISTGDVQWMIVGRGIVHSEMLVSEGINRGLYLWINLASNNKMNLRTAFRDPLKSERIYLVDPLANKTNLKKSMQPVKLLSVERLKKDLRFVVEFLSLYDSLNAFGVDAPLEISVDSAALGRTYEWDVLKSIIYSGLIESITSLGVVSSAAATDSTTFAADGNEPVQMKLHKSLRLCAFYVDLEESLGTLESTRAVYERILDLRIATPQIIINYDLLLEAGPFYCVWLVLCLFGFLVPNGFLIGFYIFTSQEHKYFEDAFKIAIRTLGSWKKQIESIGGIAGSPIG
ncbi:hypothetical protein NE237_029787 [Protea cynaroides]|uniref:Uncharacterized protein n=1 Tax=Protea cynaroides TaxID=273540 RepID=A0A9Q0JWD7_9MAGN|nr:hypothetical protein NE237_029787 [Protea cynaroides]